MSIGAPLFAPFLGLLPNPTHACMFTSHQARSCAPTGFIRWAACKAPSHPYLHFVEQAIMKTMISLLFILFLIYIVNPGCCCLDIMSKTSREGVTYRLASGDIKNNARIASAWRTAADCDLLLFIMDAARQVGLQSWSPCQDLFILHVPSFLLFLGQGSCLHLSSHHTLDLSGLCSTLCFHMGANPL